MTPAIKYLEKNKVEFSIHQYQHDPNTANYGQEAVEKMAVAAPQVFKTLVAQTDKGQLIVNIVPVEQQLSLKAVAKHLKTKKAKMAAHDTVVATTGYILGGVSPFGQKKRLTTLIDSSALSHNTIFVSGGKRGLEIEIAPEQLISLLGAHSIELAA